MSYILHIWEQPSERPAPVSVEEADQQLSELRTALPRQNPRFIALAQNLTRRFPCICSAAAEDIPESEWAWSDGPLDGKTGSAVYSIGLNSERVNEVQPFVVQSAKELKLNVMDEQAGAVYLAEGAVLTMSNCVAATAIPGAAEVPSAAELEKILFEALQPLLAEYGFKKRKRDSFRRVFSGGWQDIHINTGDDYSPRRAGFGFLYVGRLDVITELEVSVLSPQEPPEENKYRKTMACGLSSLILEPKNDPELKAISVRSYAEIDGKIEHVLTRFRSSILPMLEKCKTVEGFDEFLNVPVLADSIFYGGNPLNGCLQILTAYLAHNPNLEEICRQFEESVAPYPKSIVGNETRKCIEYVRSRMPE